MIRTLKGHTTLNARLEKNFDVIKLHSYDTIVCRVTGTRLVCSGTYSKSTRKHISWFLSDIGANISYRDVKFAACADMAIDIATGKTDYLTEEEFEFCQREKDNCNIPF